VEILVSLVASADGENKFRRADVEAKNVPGGAKRDDEFTHGRAVTDLAVGAGVAVGVRLDGLEYARGSVPLDDWPGSRTGTGGFARDLLGAKLGTPANTRLAVSGHRIQGQECR
jgi:hypothetical protein